MNEAHHPHLFSPWFPSCFLRVFSMLPCSNAPCLVQCKAPLSMPTAALGGKGGASGAAVPVRLVKAACNKKHKADAPANLDCMFSA